MPRSLRGGVADCERDVGHGLSGQIEWQSFGEHLECYDAQCVDIAPRIDVCSCAGYLLGAHIRESAYELSRLRVKRVRGGVVVGQSCHSEVEYFGLTDRVGWFGVVAGRGGRVHDENVGGFEIAVYYALLVRILHRVGNARDQF